jgi:osmoprotectant transport system permease protein
VRLLEQAARRRSRARAAVAAAGLFVVIVGCLYAPLTRLVNPPPNLVIIGSADYTEQHILTEVLKGRLERCGFSADQRRGMGESIEWMSLCSGNIDCYVDYTGNIWATVMKRKDPPADRHAAMEEIETYLRKEHGVLCVGGLGFENAYALAMPRRRAEELKIATIDDLKKYSAQWKIGGDLQFFGRPEWVKVRDTYGLQFSRDRIKPMDPDLMYPALASGEVDVICAYTSDGRIKADDLFVLADPRHAFPPYDAILMVSAKAAHRPGFLDALRPLVQSIDVETMRDANGAVAVQKRRPRQVGRELGARLESRM